MGPNNVWKICKYSFSFYLLIPAIQIHPKNGKFLVHCWMSRDPMHGFLWHLQYLLFEGYALFASSKLELSYEPPSTISILFKESDITFPLTEALAVHVSTVGGLATGHQNAPTSEVISSVLVCCTRFPATACKLMSEWERERERERCCPQPTGDFAFGAKIGGQEQFEFTSLKENSWWAGTVQFGGKGSWTSRFCHDYPLPTLPPYTCNSFDRAIVLLFAN